MVVGRFAPSPSGRMHPGNVLCALLAWLSARSQGGRLILRIEDLDTARCTPALAAALEDDLRWLGLPFDEGGSAGGPRGPYFQSRRGPLYQAALEKLQARGLVYPCFCTRAELHAADAPHGADGQVVYPGTCRDLSPEEAARRIREGGRPPALRLRVPDETVAFTDGHLGPYRESLRTECGDFLLRRSDGLWAYQLAAAADDGAMGVTEVVRGSDLLSSTPRQLLLLRLLGLPAPRYCHFPLLLAPDGRRLSKRERSLGMDVLRTRRTPEEILGTLAYLAGFHPSAAPCGPETLLDEFSWDKVPRTDIRVGKDVFSALGGEEDP
jgi:glutamyl-tRNA synthetase